MTAAARSHLRDAAEFQAEDVVVERIWSDDGHVLVRLGAAVDLPFFAGILQPLVRVESSAELAYVDQAPDN